VADEPPEGCIVTRLLMIVAVTALLGAVVVGAVAAGMAMRPASVETVEATGPPPR